MAALQEPVAGETAEAGIQNAIATRELAGRFEIERETLSASELRVRFPMFAADEETVGYFEPESGFVRPEEAVRAQLEVARRGGAR